VIFIGITFLVVIFFFEESKYVPVPNAFPASPSAYDTEDVDHKESVPAKSEIESAPGPTVQIKPKSYRQRLRLVTKTDEPMLSHFHQPLTTLFTFPAVAYCAITYGFTLCWFAIMTSLSATYMVKPPWNFGPEGVGLFNIPRLLEPPWDFCLVGIYVTGGLYGCLDATAASMSRRCDYGLLFPWRSFAQSGF
jgi:hypothetical protein